MTASNSAWLLAALVLLTPRLAWSDPPAAPPSEDQVEAGRDLYRQAKDLQRDGRTKEALERSLEAYRVAPTPVTAVLAALLLQGAGRLVEARETARAVGGMPLSPRETDKGREARQQAAVIAASLDARIPKIAVAGLPPGAEVLLDGKSLGATDSSAWRGVDPGAHALLVRLGNRTCSSVHLTLGEGEERTLDLHEVSASCPGESAAAPASASASAPDDGHAWRVAGVAVGALGVLAIGVGSVVAITAKHDYDAAANQCPAVGCSEDGYNARNDARSRGDIATGVLAGGAVAVVGGVLMWWLAPRPAGPPLSGQVTVGLGTVGVTF
jgi:anti-sigma-K factor RskA